MPPKKKAKGPRTPEKPSSASGGSSENWRCVSAQDYFAYVNHTCDDDVDKLHPWISDGKMEGYACRDCEMHGHHDSYHVLSASQVEAVMLLVEGAKPTKSRKTKSRDQDADDVNDDQRGGDPKDVRRTLSNANLNIKRTDLNRKRTVCVDDSELNETWVKANWTKHCNTMSDKLPIIGRGDIPPSFGITAVELKAQVPYCDMMGRYLSAWAEFYSKGRDSAVLLTNIETLEAGAH